MRTNNRITVFVGNYGSGKTELAMNYALDLARQGRRLRRSVG
nr:PhoH family protein [Desulfotomaculum nigrificans]